ncbi:iron ABC transporter substrate-binding protein [Methylobacterium sp. J-068]|uniref:iron ABC transporter substrate-binding protein n=1 Tax=Methylobacterium sp. J-068 TaxID=2836649 RepID=UPI001FBA77FD|nr:iron ABC transporter substrate-binding protein [Methylobacterium sp. J-068]MCJ2034923.1 iron ABC transporter substrate-binding protein [Methylobacterium sp. J-068]
MPVWTARVSRPFLAGLGLLAAAQAEARPFTDAAGRVVEVPERPARILAAGPPASVLLYTLAPDRMVGWIRGPTPEEKPYLAPGTRDLPATGRLTGRGGSANVEAVLGLKPDLIVDVGSTGPTYVSLADRVQAQTGIPYVLLDGHFDRTAESYRRLGALIGAQGPAADLASAAEAIVAEVTRAVATVPDERRPRVYYARGPKGLETGLGGSINVELLDVLGARNVAAGAGPGGLANVSPEQVLAWNPDVIITQDSGFRSGIAADPLWSGLKAVREGRVYQAPALPFGWFDAPPGANRLIGIRWLASLLYPDLFPRGLDAATRDFYRRFYHVDLDAAQVDELLSDATPGPKP